MGTDSCIYGYDPDNPDHVGPDDPNQEYPDNASTCSGLWQWLNKRNPDEYIVEFVATGPTSYAYITNKGKR
jgi:hypothetical protein